MTKFKEQDQLEKVTIKERKLKDREDREEQRRNAEQVEKEMLELEQQTRMEAERRVQKVSVLLEIMY